MKINCVLTLMGLLPLTGTGCGNESLFGLFESPLGDAICHEALQFETVPTVFPPELQSIRNDRETFKGSDHPLREVAVGTVRDDLSNLDGCWGWTSDLINPPAPIDWATIQAERTQVLKFDWTAKRLTWYYYYEAPSRLEFLPLAMLFGRHYTERPIIVNVNYDIEQVDEKLFTIRPVDYEDGGIDEEGRLVFDCFAAFYGSIEGTTTWTVVTTVEGDAMKMREELEEPAEFDVEAANDTARLWVRLDCAE